MIHLRLLGTVDARDDLGAPLKRIIAQPKRLALLAYLALGNGQLRMRDLLLAQFWPELDTTHARAALRQALHHLRRDLGEGAITGEGEGLAMNMALVQCDACDFARHVTAGDDAAALDCYGGTLLDGVHVSDASTEWEAWLDGERARLRDMALAAARRLVSAARARGDLEGAVTLARRACQLAPDDDATACALVSALSAQGDACGALRVHEAFARRMRREFELDVSPEMTALVARIRSEERSAPGIITPVEAAAIISAPHAVRSTERSWPRKRALAVAVMAMAAFAAALAWRASHAPEPTVLAIGLIRDHTGSPELAAAVSELLATDMARDAGSRVISTPRMFELLTQVDSAGGERQRMARAARLAGADEFLEGALYRDSTGLRLELDRVDLRTGRAVNSRTISGADPFVLAERATGGVLGTMRIGPPRGRLQDVVANSPMALRFYQEGVRARSQNDMAAAKRFFAAAVAEDSSFAMATFALAVMQDSVGPLHYRALHLAERTSDRERLLIQATLAHTFDDPAALAFAETLAVRYPSEPDGALMLGQALVYEGRPAEAIPPLRQVIAMDSASLRSSDACRACEAYSELASAYTHMDSMQAAERVAREYHARAPARVQSLYPLIDILDDQRHFDEVRALLGQMEVANGSALGEYGHRADLLIKEGRFGEAEAYLQRVIESTHGDDRANAQWGYTILLRNEGRYREALALAEVLRQRDARPPAAFAQRYWSGGMRAMILHDMGRYAEVIALRDSSMRTPYGSTLTRKSRSLAGEMTQAAAARAEMGDTAGLRTIAEQVEFHGSRTGYGMVRRFHHYVRGLRYGLLGRHEDAVRELRASIFSPVTGFVRENYELGKELLAAGRPAEAAYWFDAGLRGPLGAGGLGVTRPKLELMLGRARERMGDTLGAVASYEYAMAAWEHADPVVHPMRAEAASRVQALRAVRVKNSTMR
ncbi:MAG: transcriptional activator protein [Gemmatimonadetes bacterium]|nr:transcriptional activator protein [Gemmatimonadota bacterium]